MSEQEARDFLTNLCVLEGSQEKVGALIKSCRDRVASSPPHDLEARTQPLPPELEELLAEVRLDERLPKVVKNWSWSFREVEIDKLIPTQRYIDTEYIDQIADKLDLGTPEGRARFCLTDDFRVRESELVEAPAALTFAIKGQGGDLRVTDSRASYDPKTGDRTVSFTVGWGRPFVQVARLKGRYVLKNGYHRAFAIRKRGFQYLPCVLIEAEAYEDLESSGPPTFFSEEVILGSQPPVFSDFFDAAVAPPVKMRSYAKAVLIRPNYTLIDPDSLARYLSNELAEPPEQGVGERKQLTYTELRPNREDWNVYRLADGTILKMRAVATRVIRLRTDGSPGTPDISSVMVSCNPPEEMRGPPSRARPTPQELQAAVVDGDVRFTTIDEPVNEYITEDRKRILLRLRLYSLARTSKYDGRGDPIFLFNARPEVTTSDL